MSRCRKRRYSTPADAMLALCRIQGQRDIDNMEKHERTWYECSQCTRPCGGIVYHLTSWTTVEGQ